MSFTGPVAYDRFMGRYSALLSPQLANLAGVETGQRALDVGCGPGALTEELVRRLGAESVAAVDPSEPFIGAVSERYPGVDARTSSADDLPFDNDEFDVTLAQLVVHFMPDPVAGLAEMARVTRDGGVVVACVWDHGGGQGPLRSFWKAAREIDPGVDDESHLPGVRHGDLGEIFREAGLQRVEESSLAVSLQHPSFDEWWEPFTLGVGPAGAFAATLDPTARARLRELCRKFLPPPPFVVTGKAWAARGIV
ncbi:MAG: class I SAM-dependent methyltransferase [Acidimicrobiia bacterium]|jgi:SAM-dependent methyltransferase